jgi:DNA-binding NtrC family response regulator
MPRVSGPHVPSRKPHAASPGKAGGLVSLSAAPFDIVVSDMQLPGMSGVQFPARAETMAPDGVRVMRTGNADQKTAMEAVNEGRLFRFLTDLCLPETLEAALARYRLVMAEEELLERALKGSIRVLQEIRIRTAG